jgi:hypothetical protein
MTTPNEATGEAVLVTQPHTTSFSTAALVLGILGTLLCIIPFVGLPLSIGAVVLSSRQKTRDRGAGEAILTKTTAGTIMGIIGIVLSVIVGLVLVFLGWATASWA